MKLPQIIQGGMGIYVSGPSMAQSASLHGGLGTVTGVAADRAVARILQRGDPGGHFRRAFDSFPYPEVAERIYKRYYVPGGIPATSDFGNEPVFSFRPSAHLIELTVLANFSLVWLAKEGHNHPISINYLEKVQLPHLYSVFGAMLAGVDVVTVGAGIPDQFPEIFRVFAQRRAAEYRLTVDGKRSDSHCMTFDPASFFGWVPLTLFIPKFLPIVSSHGLAKHLVKTNKDDLAGFIVSPKNLGGGHKVLPRGAALILDSEGDPVYGPKDEVDFEAMNDLKIPYWLAGERGSPEGLAEALKLGASGIQAGSIFALSNESGILDRYAAWIRREGFLGNLKVKTDPRVSSTGFAFNVVQFPGTQSDEKIRADKTRRCDACYLVTFVTDRGKVTMRCPAEPEGKFECKGGNPQDTLGRGDLCNGLSVAVGLGNPHEPAILTLGKNAQSFLQRLMKNEHDRYTVSDAMTYLMSKSE